MYRGCHVQGWVVGGVKSPVHQGVMYRGCHVQGVSCTGVGGGRCEESCASGCHVLEGTSYSCVHCGAAHFLPYLFIAVLGFNQNTTVHGNTNFLVSTHALWQDSDPCSTCVCVCVCALVQSFCTLCFVYFSTIYRPHPPPSHPLGPLFPSP